jgi:glycosyltransferase involved in cell wall biosynthesis
MAIHQIVPRFAAREPIARAALELQVALRRLGHWGEIGGEQVEGSLGALGLKRKALRQAPGDVLVRHVKREDDAAVGPAILHGPSGPRLRRPDGEWAPATAENVASLQPLGAWPARSKRLRVAIVVQRYGQMPGGAEALARAVAQHLAPALDITVLTTCADNHLTWANALPPGESRDAEVSVVRFATDRSRRMWSFNRLSRRAFPKAGELFTEQRWLAEQGPSCPELLRHLAQSRGHYDGYIFFTYLYEPTVWGLPLVAERSLLVPTAHDEPPLRFGAYRDVFERPRALFCSTPEEEALIHGHFPAAARTRVVGTGIELAAGNAARFRADRPYLFYVGRIEHGKGIPELLRFHAALRKKDPRAPDLLLAGSRHMRVSGKGVRVLGRISDEDKVNAIAGAEAVVVPSRWESLSLLALEGMAQGTPVVVNAQSDVLAGQCRRSGGGEAYSDAASFIDAIAKVRAARTAYGARGRAFAGLNTWERVVAAYREELERLV